MSAGSGSLTDGFWVWSAAPPYYIGMYGLAPEKELLDHIKSRGYQPPSVTDDRARAASQKVSDLSGVVRRRRFAGCLGADAPITDSSRDGRYEAIGPLAPAAAPGSGAATSPRGCSWAGQGAPSVATRALAVVVAWRPWQSTET